MFDASTPLSNIRGRLTKEKTKQVNPPPHLLHGRQNYSKHMEHLVTE